MELHDYRTNANQPDSPHGSFSLAMALGRLHYQQGEKRLMLAVLVDACGCIERSYAGRGARSWRTRRAAVEWMNAHDQQWLFSFENICLALDLDPGKLRAVLSAKFPALFLTTSHADTSRLKVSANLRRVQGSPPPLEFLRITSMVVSPLRRPCRPDRE